jgi:hypothetical protein
MRVLSEKISDQRNFIQDLFKLHLIADTGRRFGIIFEKLKIRTGDEGIEPRRLADLSGCDSGCW